MTQELTGLQQLLLNTLRDSGDWMTRREIGTAIGRTVQHYDVQQLKTLEGLGLIESQKRKIGAVMSEYIYRSKS